jgi:hypothetical protein
VQIRRNLTQLDGTDDHRQHSAARVRPGFPRNLELGERVAPGVDGIRAQQEDEQVGFLYRAADPVVLFLAGRQILAVEEDGVPLRAQGQIDLLGLPTVLGGVAQEDPH